MNKENRMNTSGFNWLAFFFNTAYYAGKGRATKGFVLALFAWLPIFMIPIAIYCGVKANKEIDSSEFSWKHAIGVGLFQLFVGMIMFSILKR